MRNMDNEALAGREIAALGSLFNNMVRHAKSVMFGADFNHGSCRGTHRPPDRQPELHDRDRPTHLNDVMLFDSALRGLGFEVSVFRDASLGALTRAVMMSV